MRDYIKTGWIQEDVKMRRMPRLIMLMSIITHVTLSVALFLLLTQNQCRLPLFLRSTLSDCPDKGYFPLRVESKFGILFSIADTYLLYHTYGHGKV